MERRRFLTIMGMAGVAAALPLKFSLRNGFHHAMAHADFTSTWVYTQSATVNLRKFIQPLPNPLKVPGFILTPNTSAFPGSDYYQVVASAFSQQVHQDLPGPTNFWGYAADPGVGNPSTNFYLGGIIVAKHDHPVRLKVRNGLYLGNDPTSPAPHPVGPAIDTAGMFADAAPFNRIATHLHGGFPPWISDGTPFQWFDPKGLYGVSAQFVPDMPVPDLGSYTYYWPNQQSARLMWYHDHAHSITRVNAYAGLATGYVLTGPVEKFLSEGGFIPGPADPKRTLYLIIQDKTFQPNNGQLWYPDFYDPNRWPIQGGTPPYPSAVAEYFSDTILVNGQAYPFVEVEQRHIRLRILNGSQSRFYNLQLYFAASNTDTDAGSKNADLTKPGPAFVQIGNECGFLPKAALLNNPPISFSFAGLDSNGNPVGLKFNLLLAPAERADLLIDFSHVPVGSRLVLYSDAPAPFPMGDPLNDFSLANPQGGTVPLDATVGPDTRNLMQFRVIARSGPPDHITMSALGLLASRNLPGILPPVFPISQTRATKAFKTLNEDFDDMGRLIQREGTGDPVSPGVFGRFYADAPTEIIPKGSTQIQWIINLTGDTHPIHTHLVNWQILWRRPFDQAAYIAGGGGDPTPYFTGPARAADPNEKGFKETVRMNPGEVTAVIAKYDLPEVPFAVPDSMRPLDGSMPASSSNPITNFHHEYVWHCHILEHEEHDMMRPLVVA